MKQNRAIICLTYELLETKFPGRIDHIQADPERRLLKLFLSGDENFPEVPEGAVAPIIDPPPHQLSLW